MDFALLIGSGGCAVFGFVWMVWASEIDKEVLTTMTLAIACWCAWCADIEL